MLTLPLCLFSATWFWEDSKGKWNPHPEEAAEKLEVAFYTKFFNQKIRDLGLGSFYVVLDGPSGTGKQFASESSSHSQNVRRGYEGRSIPRVEVDSRERAIAASEHKKGDGNFIDFGFEDQAPVDPSTLGEDGKAKQATPKPQRKPVHGIWKEGYVGKKSGGLKEKKNIWKNRYLIITTESVGVYANRTKEKEKVALQKIARCESFRDHRCEPGFHYFCIKTYASHEYLFRAAQLSEVNEWVDVINDAIDWMKNPNRTDVISSGLSAISISTSSGSVGSSPSSSTPSSTNSTPQVTHVPPGGGGGGPGAYPGSANNSMPTLPQYTGSNPNQNPGSPQVAPYSPNPNPGPGGYPPTGNAGGYPPNNNQFNPPTGNPGGYPPTGFPPTGPGNMNPPPNTSYTPPPTGNPGGYPPTGPGSNMNPPPNNYNPTPNNYNPTPGGYPPGPGYPPAIGGGSGFNQPPPGPSYPPNNNYNPNPPGPAYPPTGIGYPGLGGGGNGGGWNPPQNNPYPPPTNNFVPPNNPPTGFSTGYNPGGVGPGGMSPSYPPPNYNPTSTPGYPPSGFPPTQNYGYPPTY